MSNSSRWRRLCEWVRYLQDTNGVVDLPNLVNKMEEIKRGLGDYIERTESQDRQQVTIDELDNFLNNFEMLANKDLLIRTDVAKYLVIKYNITKR